MSKTQLIDQVKTWLTPGVIGVLGMFIWRDLSELRADVKQLLAQGTEYHIKIAKLEADVEILNERFLFKESAALFQDLSGNRNRANYYPALLRMRSHNPLFLARGYE